MSPALLTIINEMGRAPLEPLASPAVGIWFELVSHNWFENWAAGGSNKQMPES